MRQFAPEARGHGVPEVIVAVARENGNIRPRVALIEILASGFCIGTGGSVGCEGPIVQIGASLDALFGILCNLLVSSISAHPGLYAIVGMGAVVVGTTHGVLSAIVIVYELTEDYQIILPIMAAADLSTIVSSFLNPESIYHKKLSRRGVRLARGHDVHRVEHVMVRHDPLFPQRAAF